MVRFPFVPVGHLRIHVAWLQFVESVTHRNPWREQSNDLECIRADDEETNSTRTTRHLDDHVLVITTRVGDLATELVRVRSRDMPRARRGHARLQLETEFCHSRS